MKLLNVHKYKLGDRLQNIDCPQRIQVVKGMFMNQGFGKLYETYCEGRRYYLSEKYLDDKYRRIQ